MSEDDFETVFDWSHEAHTVAAGRGVEVDRSASAKERGALLDALDLASCERVDVRYKIQPRAGGRFQMTGRILADLAQICVVTLAPVPAHLDITLNLEFWPSDSVERGGAFDAMGPSDPEPIEDGRLDVGRVVYEEIAAALDPYPRAPGAEFQSEAAAKEAKDNPFAALARLKRSE
jgi:uncharacterized metal-binding protein YceD (DUF177 family)